MSEADSHECCCPVCDFRNGDIWRRKEIASEMNIEDKLLSQVGDDVQFIFDMDALLKRAAEDLRGMRAALTGIYRGAPHMSHAQVTAAAALDKIGSDGLVEPAPPMTGAEAIAAERARQIDEEGRLLADDDMHRHDELARAAASYLLSGLCVFQVHLGQRARALAHDIWPWADRRWKPRTRRDDLVRAGALIAAEIDRLDRARALELVEQAQKEGCK